MFLKDDASAAQLKMVDDLIAGSGLAAERQYVSKADALTKFRQEFPDLAPATARLERNPFPASFEVRLKAGSAEGRRGGGQPGEPRFQACRQSPRSATTDAGSAV